MIVLPRTRQPQGVAKANPQHRVWASFNGAVTAHNAGPGVLWQPATGGVTPIVGPAGRALSFAGGANTGKWTTTLPSILGEVTVVFVVANLNGGNGGGGAGRIISCFNGSTSAPFDVYVSATSLITLQKSFSTTNFQYQFPAGVGTTARPDVVVAWFPIAAGVAPRGWVNGVEQTISLLTGPSVGTASAGNANVSVGGRPDVTTRQLAGDVYMAGLLDGFPIDAVKLSTNPWQIFDSEVIYVKAASAAAFNPAWARTANQTLIGGQIAS